MDIAFKKPKLGKTCNSEDALRKVHGDRRARVIMRRLTVLNAAPNLAAVPHTPPDRLHQLKGDRDEQVAVDLVVVSKKVVQPDHDPIPRRGDGGVELESVTAITVIEIVDYH